MYFCDYKTTTHPQSILTSFVLSSHNCLAISSFLAYGLDSPTWQLSKYFPAKIRSYYERKTHPRSLYPSTGGH